MSYFDQYDVNILASQVLESLEMFRIRLREVQRIQTITTLFGLLTQKEKRGMYCILYWRKYEKITESPEGITEDLKEMSFNLRATLIAGLLLSKREIIFF